MEEIRSMGGSKDPREKKKEIKENDCIWEVRKGPEDLTMRTQSCKELQSPEKK